MKLRSFYANACPHLSYSTDISTCYKNLQESASVESTQCNLCQIFNFVSYKSIKSPINFKSHKSFHILFWALKFQIIFISDFWKITSMLFRYLYTSYKENTIFYGTHSWISSLSLSVTKILKPAWNYTVEVREIFRRFMYRQSWRLIQYSISDFDYIDSISTLRFIARRMTKGNEGGHDRFFLY